METLWFLEGKAQAEDFIQARKDLEKSLELDEKIFEEFLEMNFKNLLHREEFEKGFRSVIK